MPERADFHIHYYPESTQLQEHINLIIKKAQEHNISSMALLGRSEIADQKTTESIQQQFEQVGIKIFFGMEYSPTLPPDINSLTKKAHVDIVCLGFDHNGQEIQQTFGTQDHKEKSAIIARKQLILLKAHGFTIAPTDPQYKHLLQEVLSGNITAKAINFCKIIAAQPEINQRTIKKIQKHHPFNPQEHDKNNGHSPLTNWLYQVLFKPPRGLAYFPVQISVTKTIQLVHQHGGLVIYSPEGGFSEPLMKYLLNQEIDGVMAWHGGKLKDVPIKWVKRIRKMGLLVLGGSDFDPLKNDWQPGIGRGEMYISSRRQQRLSDKLATSDRLTR